MQNERNNVKVEYGVVKPHVAILAERFTEKTEKEKACLTRETLLGKVIFVRLCDTNYATESEFDKLCNEYDVPNSQQKTESRYIKITDENVEKIGTFLHALRITELKYEVILMAMLGRLEDYAHTFISNLNIYRALCESGSITMGAEVVEALAGTKRYEIK